MRVLVTGATGFVGKRLCAALVAQGDEVVALTRDAQKAAAQLPGSVVAYEWNVWAEVPPLAAFNKVDAVVHLAGGGIADKRWSEKQKRVIYDSRILGTRYLVKALRELNTPPRVLVAASAIGFYGDRGEETLDEESKPGTGFLPLVCADWEKEASGAEDKLRTVKLRIGIVFGNNGGMMAKLLPLFKLGLGGPVSSGKQYMSWIHVDDLVGLILHSITIESMRGVYNAVAPVPVTNEDFTKAFATAVHRPAVFRAPAAAMKLAMGEMSQLVLASQKVFPKRTAETGFRYRFAELSAALAEVVKKKVVRKELSASSNG